MIEGDDEDLWLACFQEATALVPKNGYRTVKKICDCTDELFERIKAKTSKSVEKQKKLAPVVQLKG